MGKIGDELHRLARQLWPINRSITGDGVRETLSILREYLPSMTIHEVPSGTKVLDWVVPREWRVRDAYVVSPNGTKICDFRSNNLHLVGYSTSFRGRVDLSELQRHLYSLPEQPDAIPYVTSYYQESWGFCLPERIRSSLVEGIYEVVIDTEHFEGSLTYGELILPGRLQNEVFFSTYVCHPSMANNELSGPCVTTALATRIASNPARKYTYRFVFVPETIGSITYLSRNLEVLKERVLAGFNVTCVGDDRGYSFLPSRNGSTLSDDVARHVLAKIDPGYSIYEWADRGSDERQYCAPGVDLPIASIMRTKYGEFDEYHTSLDDLEKVVTPEGLEGGFDALWRAVEALENHCFPKAALLGEPQLGKRGLYPMISTRNSASEVRLLMDLLTWSDGCNSLVEIAEKCGCPVWALYPLVDRLSSEGLLLLSEVRDTS